MVEIPSRDLSSIGYFIAIVVLILVAILMLIFVSARYSFLYRMNQISNESTIIMMT